MKRIIFLIVTCVMLATWSAFASESVGTVGTTDVSTGLNFTLACNPTTVSNGTVNASTCAITCDSGFQLSGLSCVAVSTGGGGGWGGGGGGGGWSSIFVGTTTSASGTVTSTGVVTSTIPVVTTSTSTIPPVTLSVSQLLFRDIGSNWANEYIVKLALRKIINNTEAFRPNDTLTRAEFLKMVGNTAGWNLPTVTTNPFTDVAKTQWYAPYAKFALNQGIIASASQFRPNDPITRAEVAKILVGALGLPMKSPPTGVFSDVSLSSTLIVYVEAVKTAGVFDGQIVDGKLIFRPSDNITRAEITKVLVKAFRL